MRQHDLSSPRRQGRRLGAWAAIGALTTTVLGGCAAGNLRGDASTGWLPPAVTEGGERVTTLWIGAWITLIAVGLLVLGLTVWCMVAYRRRKDDNELPVQLRYNLPIEILYTVVPILMVVVFFYYTARDEAALIDTSTRARRDRQRRRQAVVAGTSTTSRTTSTRSAPRRSSPVSPAPRRPSRRSYLPVNERTEFVLTSRDVIHSFWVPAFLLRRWTSMPGRVNRFQVMPTREGDFEGKCAELCGAYHSQMLFNVKVVAPRRVRRPHGRAARRGPDGAAEQRPSTGASCMDGQTVTTDGGN